MSETVKFRTFCGQPMGNKSVAQIPGVGPMAAKKLISMDCSKATDLYKRLKKLDFEEKRFRVWLTINCKGARVSHIYKALMGWHAQFGDQEDDDDFDDATAATPQKRLVIRGARKTPKRPRNSVQFDLPPNHRDSTPANDSTNSNNPLTLFFASFADTCKNISPEYHTALKMEILGVVDKYENKSREKKNRPSTSYAANGV